MPSLTLHYRPLETHFYETAHSATWAVYTIKVLVWFFADEAMGTLSYTKEMTFENINFRPEWMGVMGEIYELINKNNG